MNRTTSLATAVFTAVLLSASVAWAGCAGHQQSVEDTSMQTVMITKPVATPAPSDEKDG